MRNQDRRRTTHRCLGDKFCVGNLPASGRGIGCQSVDLVRSWKKDSPEEVRERLVIDIKNGVTGFECFRVDEYFFTPIINDPKGMWALCAGTKGSWSKLVVPKWQMLQAVFPEKVRERMDDETHKKFLDAACSIAGCSFGGLESMALEVDESVKKCVKFIEERGLKELYREMSVAESM